MNKLRSVSCGISGLDEILGGFKVPSTILIAGTAGVNKTTMVLQMLSNAARQGEKTLYIPLTTESPEKIDMFTSTLDFFDGSVQIHGINRQVAEKDPLSTLIDMGNIIASVNPDRLAIDPITPLGFGFAEQEKRRFFYTFNSMVQEWNAVVLLTGELLENELHRSVISHLVDGIIYLSREEIGFRNRYYLKILKMRDIDPQLRSEYISHKFQTGITSDGFVVYPRLKPIKDIIQQDTKIESGITGLDMMLKDGILYGSNMLVAGGPGTGKSILGLQFINKGLIEGNSGIIATFEERPDQLLLMAKKMGWDLQGYIDDGLLKIIYVNPEDVCPAEHALRIKKYVESMNAKRVFFDGIANLEMTMPNHLQTREYLHLLTDYLKSKNVTSLFTTELSANGSDQITSPDASFIMDSVVILKQVRSKNILRKYLYILKSRGTKHDCIVREYFITDRGIDVKINTLL